MKVNPDRIVTMLAAVADWTELESAVGSIVANTLRNNGPAVEEARRRAHDLLDQHIDHKIENVALIRADIEKQAREI